MAWTLEQAKIYLEIDPGDTSQDQFIQEVLDETQEYLETLLGRELFLTREVVRFIEVTGDTLLMPRFPIKEVHAITGIWPETDFNDSTVRVQKTVGRISSTQFEGMAEINVDYEGGFEVLPIDLERAMWSAFLTRYEDTNPTTGAPPKGTGTSVVAGSGEVSSVTIPDFATIKYDVGSTVTSADQQASKAEWGWLAPWATVFQQYRAGQAGTGLGLV